MKEDILLDKFQYAIACYPKMNKGILDCLTKFQDACSRVNRSIVKSISQCGCCDILPYKKDSSEESEIHQEKKGIDTHLKGILCDECRYIVEKEMGQSLFFISSLCNILDLNLYDILIKEHERVELLGKYSLR